MLTRGGSKQKRKVDGCTPEKYRGKSLWKRYKPNALQKKKVVLQQQKNKSILIAGSTKKNAFQQKKYAKSAKKRNQTTDSLFVLLRRPMSSSGLSQAGVVGGLQSRPPVFGQTVAPISIRGKIMPTRVLQASHLDFQTLRRP